MKRVEKSLYSETIEGTEYFVDGRSLRYGGPKKIFAPEFVQALNAYAWPGNVRELFQALDRAFAMANDSPTFHLKHLPEELRIDLARSSFAVSRSMQDKENDSVPAEALQSWKTFKDRAEYDYLVQLLRGSGHDINEACRISGLSRARIYQLIRKHNLQKSAPDTSSF